MVLNVSKGPTSGVWDSIQVYCKLNMESGPVPTLPVPMKYEVKEGRVAFRSTVYVHLRSYGLHCENKPVLLTFCPTGH